MRFQLCQPTSGTHLNSLAGLDEELELGAARLGNLVKLISVLCERECVCEREIEVFMSTCLFIHCYLLS